jgi:hypothetical protein
LRARGIAEEAPAPPDAWIAAGVALVVRAAVVVWAAGRFPASGDGTYYDLLARRLAEGHGYTWLWPDGAVTNVAHYPVGYPALMAAAYLVAGFRPAAPMGMNAIFGAAMAFAVHRLVAPSGSRRRALGAALAVGLHPALVPYTAALMTEGVAASLVVIAVALARWTPRWRWGGVVAAGIALGVATLVRPQCLALAPVLGLLSPPSGGIGGRVRAAVVTAALTLAVCAPWTARNCRAMGTCALVSVNGGWNLLIGAQTTSGMWQEVGVPEACRTVWDEAGKDACFGRAARVEILRAPMAWVARAEAKVAVTFDYFGGAPWYLHLANPEAFSERAKLVLGGVETVASRVALLFALWSVAFAEGARKRARIALAAPGAVACFLTWGYVGYLALAGAILLLGRTLARAPILVPWTAVMIGATAATHAVFFGAGRYGLVVVPFVTALPFVIGLRTASPPVASASRASSRASPSSSSAAAD